MTRDELIWTLLSQNLISANLETGEVFSDRTKGGRTGGKLMGSVNPDGYLVSTICLGKIKRTVSQHRIILAAKLGYQLPVGSICDHINRNRLDNRAENLRLVTPLENTRNRRYMRWESNPNAKMTFEKADEIRDFYKNSKSPITKRKSLARTAEKFSVSLSLVGYIVRGQYWNRDNPNFSQKDSRAIFKNRLVS